MQNLKIAISGYGSVSPLGIEAKGIWKRYLDDEHCFYKKDFDSVKEWVGPLSEDAKKLISALSISKKYNQLDPSVLYAIAASRSAVQQAGWDENSEFGINIGSSRGATAIFEKYHSEFIESGSIGPRKTNPLTSPSTTLGNIASWVAADVNATGPVISHSSTCSTALQAVANAIVWIKSGFCSKFLAGGSEAPLTAFTIAQMKALKIYSDLDNDYPCRSMDLSKVYNSMILGEGAASFCLELSPKNALAYITGLGYGSEIIKHGTSISADGTSLQKSMKLALDGHDPESVDIILLHSPGTVQGDQSEMQAVQAIFGQNKPLLTSNKWKIGHTLGASGALSMEMALLMLKHNKFIQSPYLPPQTQTKPLQKILINAVGFGGIAMSLLIEKPVN